MVHRLLRPHFPTAVYDSNPKALERLDDASSLEAVLTSPTVVLCVPISQIREVASQLAPRSRAGQLVVDTCSVKVEPLKVLCEVLDPKVEVLGTHPLFGPDSGAEGVAGLKMVTCPARISEKNYALVQRFLRKLGLVIIEATPEEHDDQIARTQAIFHLIAQALKELEWAGLPISTPGPEAFFRLVSTVQRDTHQLFLDMQQQNPFAATYRQLFFDQLAGLQERIRRGQQAG